MFNKTKPYYQIRKEILKRLSQETDALYSDVRFMFRQNLYSDYYAVYIQETIKKLKDDIANDKYTVQSNIDLLTVANLLYQNPFSFNLSYSEINFLWYGLCKVIKPSQFKEKTTLNVALKVFVECLEDCAKIIPYFTDGSDLAGAKEKYEKEQNEKSKEIFCPTWVKEFDTKTLFECIVDNTLLIEKIPHILPSEISKINADIFNSIFTEILFSKSLTKLTKNSINILINIFLQLRAYDFLQKEEYNDKVFELWDILRNELTIIAKHI